MFCRMQNSYAQRQKCQVFGVRGDGVHVLQTINACLVFANSCLQKTRLAYMPSLTPPLLLFLCGWFFLPFLPCGCFFSILLWLVLLPLPPFPSSLLPSLVLFSFGSFPSSPVDEESVCQNHDPKIFLVLTHCFLVFFAHVDEQNVCFEGISSSLITASRSHQNLYSPLSAAALQCFSCSSAPHVAAVGVNSSHHHIAITLFMTCIVQGISNVVRGENYLKPKQRAEMRRGKESKKAWQNFFSP